MAYFSDEYQTDEALTHSYRHRTWDVDEAIFFADQKTDMDSKRIVAFQKDLEKKGERGDMSGLALLYVMARSWTVRLPTGFRQPVLDSNGKVVKKDGQVLTEPHPLAGQTPPLTFEWMRKVGEPVLVDALTDLVNHYGDQYVASKEGHKSPAETGTAPDRPTARKRVAGQAGGDAASTD